MSDKYDQTKHRNTSTDVEKTELLKQMKKALQKHLHGRGEDSKIWH